MALDVGTKGEAERLVKALSPQVSVFKVGKELFTAEGPAVIQMIHSYGAKVFLDLKFHDIPNTVGAACAAAAGHGVFMLNVHALGGRKMMAQAVESARRAAENAKKAPPVLLAVTVLTSLAESDLREMGVERPLETEVRELALLAKACGLNGVVASGREIKLVREAAGKDFLIVTPGVRPLWAAQGDQKRVVTPKEAMELGADYIVVGRPITQDPAPASAAERVLKELAGFC